MNIQFEYNEDDDIVGYNLVPEDEKDRRDLGRIRDMHFFGTGEHVVKYNGISYIDGADRPYGTSDIAQLSFLQKGEKEQRKLDLLSGS